MQGLLAKINQQKNATSASKGLSRSASIASSIDDPNEEDQQSNSDESQSQQTSNTLKPTVKRDKTDKKGGWNAKAEVKPKITSRINTNMVKLKLLDATRKAIIDKTKKQFTSSYSQTDTFKTKLCRDVEIDNQADLFNPVDQSTETDVELVAYKAKDGSLIITTTCAVNTDNPITCQTSTQTVMPRSNISFKRALDMKRTIQYADEDEDGDLTNDDDMFDRSAEIMSIEKRMRSKKKLSRQRSSPQRSNIEDFDDDTAKVADPVVKSQNDSDSEFEDSIQDDLQPDVVKASVKRAKGDTTFNSWHDLDGYDTKIELPKSYFAEGPTPWSNFHDLVLGQRFLNARLGAHPQRNARPNFKPAAWSDSQAKIVNDLIREANALMDMFDQVAMLLGPDIKLHNVSDVEEFKLPPSKFSSEMAQSCDKLEASLKRLQDIKVTDKGS